MHSLPMSPRLHNRRVLHFCVSRDALPPSPTLQRAESTLPRILIIRVRTVTTRPWLSCVARVNWES